MKTCKSCHQSKDLAEYYQDKAYREGYRPTCKHCYLTARRAARDALGPKEREELRSRWRRSSKASYAKRAGGSVGAE